MERTTATTSDTWHICHSNGYRFVVDAIVEGRENALQIGAFIAAGSDVNTTYRARDPRHRKEIGSWDTQKRAHKRLTIDEIAAQYVSNMSAKQYMAALEELDTGDLLVAKTAILVRSPEDTAPDGPCEVTRWLEQQFGKESTEGPY